MSGQWIVRARRPRPAARLRLLCVPYAGGGVSAYAGWADGLPDDVDVLTVRLPGRESRLSQRPHTDVHDLFPELGRDVLSTVEPPFVLFGHSMGALIAYELTRWLRAVGGPQPDHLFVSARQAPHLARQVASPWDLPDDRFVQALRALGGTPEELLANPAVMRLLLPVLRADFRLNDAYRHRPGPPLDCPVTVFGGRDDPVVGEPGLRGWAGHTRGSFDLHMFEGGHFFLHSARQDLLRRIVSTTTGGPRAPLGTKAVVR
ncbi:thioesterase II family protein [Streptomyces humi]